MEYVNLSLSIQMKQIIPIELFTIFISVDV